MNKAAMKSYVTIMYTYVLDIGYLCHMVNLVGEKFITLNQPLHHFGLRYFITVFR